LLREGFQKELTKLLRVGTVQILQVVGRIQSGKEIGFGYGED
jgi:hypothetical protein